MPDLIPIFLSDLEAEGVSPHTLRTYGQDLRAWASGDRCRARVSTAS